MITETQPSPEVKTSDSHPIPKRMIRLRPTQSLGERFPAMHLVRSSWFARMLSRLMFIILIATTALLAPDSTKLEEFYSILLYNCYWALLNVLVMMTVPLEELHGRDTLVNRWRHVRFAGTEKPVGSLTESCEA